MTLPCASRKPGYSMPRKTTDLVTESVPPGATSALELSRRQLLRGVAGSTAISLLVTIPATAASAAPGAAADRPAGDVFWLVGTSSTEDGYIAQAVAPDATVVAEIHGLQHAVGRTADGTRVVEAAAAAGVPTTLRVFAAGTGAVVHSIRGGFAWPAEPDLLVSVSPTSGKVAVVGTCFVGTPSGRTVVKEAPDGGQRTVPTLSWQAYRGVEVFDAATGTLVSSSKPEQIALGASDQLAHVGDEVLLLEHGADRTQFAVSPNASFGSARAALTGHAHLAHADAGGRAYLLTDDGNLLIVGKGGARHTAALNLHAAEKLTARPYTPTVVNTAADTVAVVDASRQYLATVDVASGKVLAQRKLSTASRFAPGMSLTGPGGAAVDTARGRLYVLDKSGVAGGVWVHDAHTLEVLDRWHSDVAFSLVWVAPGSGAVYLQTLEGPLAVHDATGTLVSFVPSSLATARAL
jgi:DNA-binding beta-propeller fold protein YncE